MYDKNVQVRKNSWSQKRKPICAFLCSPQLDKALTNEIKHDIHPKYTVN